MLVHSQWGASRLAAFSSYDEQFPLFALFGDLVVGNGGHRDMVALGEIPGALAPFFAFRRCREQPWKIDQPQGEASNCALKSATLHLGSRESATKYQSCIVADVVLLIENGWEGTEAGRDTTTGLGVMTLKYVEVFSHCGIATDVTVNRNNIVPIECQHRRQLTDAGADLPNAPEFPDTLPQRGQCGQVAFTQQCAMTKLSGVIRIQTRGILAHRCETIDKGCFKRGQCAFLDFAQNFVATVAQEALGWVHWEKASHSYWGRASRRLCPESRFDVEIKRDVLPARAI